MKKNEYHHGNLKEEMLKIAFDFIKEHSIEKLTLKVLSDATNTSRSAIYRHFKSKDALIETMIIEGFKEFDNAVSPILKDKSIPLKKRFFKSGEAYINFAIDNPNLYKLLFGKRYAHIREEIINLKNSNSIGFSSLQDAIKEGQKVGLLKKDNSFNKAILVWSSLHGLSTLIIDGFMDIEKNYKNLYKDLFNNLLFGMVTNKIRLASVFK
jgi:AcrR family transcriptional regulator